MEEPMTVGCFEKVSFPELGLDNVIAKIDTGAYSGALHCTDIRVVQRGPGKKKILKFRPHGHPELNEETEKFKQTYVRSALGHRSRRFIIETTINLNSQTYPIRIGLSDRSDMKKPVLIGRRFLRENNIIVDVRINAEYDDEGENSK